MNEPDVSDLITVAQAIAILDAVTVEPRTCRHKLTNVAGKRLAQDVYADRDYPPFDKSLMDGFAVRAADIEANVASLRIVGEVRAGQASELTLKQGEAIAITTGAPIPAGADSVVPIEFVECSGEHIHLIRPGDFKRFVAAAGSDCAAGELVLKRGARLDAAQLAAAATVGAEEIEVFEPPRVAILATGDELVDISQPPLPHQIRNSNSLMLQALLRHFGCEITDLGIVKDDMTQTLTAIRCGLEFDALFITGGMSVGAYDLPPQALGQLGAKFQITKLKIKPGKPFLYTKLGRCHIFGLPGNPLAGFVCTLRLASRIIRRLAGETIGEDLIIAKLGSDLTTNGPREFYQPAILKNGVVEPMAWKGSADLFTLARANALLVRAANEPAQSTGARCKLLPIQH